MPEVNELFEIALVFICILHKLVVKQLLSRGSLLGILRQTLLYEIFELFRKSLVDLRWVFGDDIVQNFSLLFANIWWLTIGDLHSKYSKRPNIHLMIVILLESDQLGRHPTYGTDLANCSSFLLVELCRVTKICQLYITFSIYKNVVTFDISVNDSSRMQIVKCLKSLPKDVGADLLVDVASSLLQNLSQISNIHELEEDPELLTVVKGLDALQDAILAIAHLHDGHLVPDIFVFIGVFWFYQL